MEATTLHLPRSLEPQFRHSVALYEMAHRDLQCCGSNYELNGVEMPQIKETRKIPMVNSKAQDVQEKLRLKVGAAKRKWAPV
jgi:hypothetical protein